MKKMQIIKNSTYKYYIYSPKGSNTIEIKSMLDAQTGEIIGPDKFDRIYKKPANIEDLKQEISWNLNQDPSKMLIIWQPEGWGVVYSTRAV